MILDLAHLERRGVTVTHQIVDESPVLADLSGPAAIGDSRRLNDSSVVTHVIDNADKTVIEHRQRLAKDLLQRRHRGAQRLAGFAPLGGDFILLLWRKPHSLIRVDRRRLDVTAVRAPSEPLDRVPASVKVGAPVGRGPSAHPRTRARSKTASRGRNSRRYRGMRS